jgi:hypothetical protein
MNAIDALKEFTQFLQEQGKSIDVISSQDGIDCMLDFYTEVRADECDIEADDDMLLFQWGTYDWGEGESFEYNITRQLIVPMEFEDDEESWMEDIFWQLSLTFKYHPSVELRDVESGDQWCHSPSDVMDFSEFVRSTKATKLVQLQEYVSTSLEYFQV